MSIKNLECYSEMTKCNVTAVKFACQSMIVCVDSNGACLVLLFSNLNVLLQLMFLRI